MVFQVSGSPSGVLETSKGLVDSYGGGNTGSLRPLFDKGSVTHDFCRPVFMGAAEIGGSETLVNRGFWEGAFPPPSLLKNPFRVAVATFFVAVATSLILLWCGKNWG